MKIKSYELSQIIDSAILEYNQDFYGEELEKHGLPLVEDDNEISEEILSKIKKLRITIIPERLSEEEVESFNSELMQVLEKMKLEVFTINVLSKSKIPQEYDVSFLNNINADVKNLQLIGIDLSKKEPELFEKFKNLLFFSVDKCNISNPKIFSKLSEDVRISLKSNKIDVKYYPEMIELIKIHNGKVGTSDNELNKIAQAFNFMKKIDIQTFLKTKDIVNYGEIEGLTICVDDTYGPSVEELEKDINILNNTKNIIIEANIKDYLRISKAKSITTPTRVIIKNASELSVGIMEGNSNIESVSIQEISNSTKEEAEPYTRDEYIKVRKRIDEIISSIKFPEKTDSKRERKIFAQVYKKLAGLIVYDDYAVSKEGEKDRELQIKCRNLYGGLVDGKSVCAGYADILRNVLQCVNIDADFIGELINTEGGSTFRIDSGGHAWNMVTLDGKKYLTDLTWDRDNIVAGRYPLEYCLKSKRDFKHERYASNHFQDGQCVESLSDEEQVELFTESRVYDSSPRQKNVSYLSGLIMHAAENRINRITNKRC